MFLGSKFCGHCGERASTVDLVEDEKAGDCPRCKQRLQSLKLDTTSIRECLKCGGFWASIETFEDVCADKDQQSAVLNFISAHPIASPIAPIKYVPCPDCEQLMNRSNFARSSGVIIDLCKQHGVWFDRDELPKIIEFIDGGGLARSREKEKIALQEERGRLRDEQRKLALMERRSGGVVRGDIEDRNSGFGGVIAKLFDL